MRVCSPATHHRSLKNNFTNCRFGVRNISAAQLLHALLFLLPQTQTRIDRLVAVGQSLWVTSCWRANSWRKIIHLQQADLHLELGDHISRDEDSERWCVCVFVCSPVCIWVWQGCGVARGVDYHKDYPCAGKYCRYKGQVFFGGGGLSLFL